MKSQPYFMNLYNRSGPGSLARFVGATVGFIGSMSLLTTGLAAYMYFTQPTFDSTPGEQAVINSCVGAFKAHPGVKVSFDHVARQYKQTQGTSFPADSYYASVVDEVLIKQEAAACKTMFSKSQQRSFGECFKDAVGMALHSCRNYFTGHRSHFEF